MGDGEGGETEARTRPWYPRRYAFRTVRGIVSKRLLNWLYTMWSQSTSKEDERALEDDERVLVRQSTSATWT
jgi:hypothetical protein